MIEVIRLGSPNRNRYGRYFLASEADDEQQADLSEVKFNTKLIEIKPSKRGKDFTADIEEELPEEEPIDTTSEIDDIDSSMDYTSDDPTPQEDTTNTDPSVEDPENTMDGPPDDPTGDLMNDQTDFNQYGDQTTQDDGGEVEVNTDADEMGGEDEPMTDDQDFTGDAENPEEGDPNAAPEAAPQAKGPGLEFDSTRKYLLFKSFGTLSNAIENYISKLSDCMTDDLERNKVVMKAIDKLKEINDLCKDYMLMKFEISSYIQSLLFYQNLVVMVQTVFGFFGKNTKKKKNEKPTTKH